MPGQGRINVAQASSLCLQFGHLQGVIASPEIGRFRFTGPCAVNSRHRLEAHATLLADPDQAALQRENITSALACDIFGLRFPNRLSCDDGSDRASFQFPSIKRCVAGAGKRLLSAECPFEIRVDNRNVRICSDPKCSFW